MPLETEVDLTTRHARLGDAPALSALMCELGYETTATEMRRRLKSIFSDARFRTFVAEINGQVCGMIGTLTHASHEHNDFTGRITALVVSRKRRRSGIGRALVAAAEKDFVEKRVTRVSLTTRLTRQHAHRFYQSLGYSRTGFRFAKELPLVTRRRPIIASSRTDPSDSRS